jgi:hypothetical protein
MAIGATFAAHHVSVEQKALLAIDALTIGSCAGIDQCQ